MNTRCLMLMMVWMAVSLAIPALLTGYGLREQITAAWVMVPWLFITAVTFIGVVVAPEEV
jgi:hypothetical protein